MRVVSGASVGFAIAAAICLALASALQHQAATDEQSYRSGIHLLWQLAHRPRWMVGLAVAAIGLALHAAALHSGALAVVQPLLVMGLAFALPLRALLDRARPAAGQVLAAAVLAGGVAVFVVAAHPSAGQAASDNDAAAAVIGAGVVLAGACSMIAARGRSGRLAGFALGLAAGILYGLVGGVLKAAVHNVTHHPVAAITTWPVWVLIALGAWAFIVHQRAYTLAPLSVSLPALSTANPLAAMVFGAAVFGERPATGLLAVSGQVLGLVVIVTSVTMLARSGGDAASQSGSQPGSQPRSQPGGQAASAGARRDPAAGREGRIWGRNFVRR